MDKSRIQILAQPRIQISNVFPNFFYTGRYVDTMGIEKTLAHINYHLAEEISEILHFQVLMFQHCNVQYLILALKQKKKSHKNEITKYEQFFVLTTKWETIGFRHK